MEALCGVSAACLTIYDMLKYTGQEMTIENIRLIEKSGGRSGHYKRSD
jgi:cyclic pyranopterin phosphate synthase